MKNIVVNIVKGAWAWVDWGSQIGHGGVPGLPRDRGSHVDENTISASGALLGRSGGVCGLSGRLRGAPGGTLETFWEFLGSSRNTFWEYFLNEKQFFAIFNRKTYAKRVST